MEDFIRSLTLIDIVVGLVVMAMFIVGWLQGAIRQLLSLAAFVVAFLLAANLRDLLGDFLARNWTFYDRDFNFMLALLGLWFVFSVTFQVAIQLFYQRVPIHRRLVWLDEIAGSILGALQVLVVLAFLTIIFDTYYGAGAPRADIGWARSVAGLLEESAIVGELRLSLIPALEAVLEPLLPAGLVGLFG